MYLHTLPTRQKRKRTAVGVRGSAFEAAGLANLVRSVDRRFSKNFIYRGNFASISVQQSKNTFSVSLSVIGWSLSQRIMASIRSIGSHRTADSLSVLALLLFQKVKSVSTNRKVVVDNPNPGVTWILV